MAWHKTLTFLFLSLILIVADSKAWANTKPTDEMLKWAEQNPVVTIEADKAIPPYDFLNENNEPKGLGSDLVRKLNSILPFHLTYGEGQTFNEQISRVIEGQSDLFSLCAILPERADKVIFSVPVFTKQSVLAVNINSDIKDVAHVLNKHKIGYGAGYATFKDLEALPRQPEAVAVETVEKGLIAVNKGALDAFVTDLGQISYWAERERLKNISIIPIPDVKAMKMGYCINKNQQELRDWINWGLAKIPNDEFHNLKVKWLAENYTKKQNSKKRAELNNSLVIVSSLVVVTLLIVLIVFVSRRQAHLIADKFGSSNFRNIYVLTLFIICSGIGLTAYSIVFNYKLSTIQDISNKLDLNINSLDIQLLSWFDERQLLVSEVAHQTDIEQIAEKLVALGKQNPELLAQSELVTQFNESSVAQAIYYSKAVGYYLVSPEGINLSAKNTSIVGKESIIKRYEPRALERTLIGQTLFVPPVWSDVDRDGDTSEGDKDPVILMATPVRNQQSKIIAALVFVYEPEGEFSEIFNSTRLGRTGESYALNSQGYMVSNSRFRNQLIRDGRIASGETAILRIKMPDTGSSGLLAASLDGVTGEDLDGYQDYRGGVVLGAWHWHPQMEMLLVSEIDFEEVMTDYNDIKFRVIIITAIAIFSIFTVSIFMLMVGQRAHIVQIASKKKLEGLVEQRTQALVEQKEVLAESEQANRLILSSVADGIISLSLTGECNFANKAALGILKMTEQTILNKDVLSILKPSAIEKEQDTSLAEMIRNAISNKASLTQMTGSFVNGQGLAFPVEFSLNPVRGSGLVTGAVLTFKDNTEQQHTIDRMFKVINAAPVAMIAINQQGVIEVVNEQCAQLFNYQKSAMVGQPIELIVPKHLTNHANWVQQFMAQPKSLLLSGDDVVGVKSDDSTFDAEVTINPIELQDGLMAVAGIRDVTEDNQAKKALLEAKELSDEASAAKSNFLANMSHEIRTPMNAIIGMSHLALQGSLQRRERSYVSKVHNAATNLLGIINDILDFSKIEAGKLELDTNDFRTEELLDSVKNVLFVKTQEKGLDLIFRVEQDVPNFLVGDQLRLAQILINLGSNAIKFTERGEVIIRVSVEQLQDNELTLKFMVKDSGIGMSEQQTQKLFKSFSQGDASTTRKYGGTGLGLSISKRLVNLMYGRIWVESELDVGSQFFFTAQLTVSQQQDSVELPEAELNLLVGKKVLIIDDSPAAVDVLKQITESFGCQVYTALSGSQALEIVNAVDGFDLALVDWQMPGMNGIETCEAIRQVQNMKHFIMVSAFGREEIGEDKLQGHVDSLMVKPITQSGLFEELMRLMGRKVKVGHQFDKNAEVQIQREKVKGAYVLLVEDNELNQELAIALLEEAGLRVDLAENGKVAVALAEKNDYDGILMDIQMPIMDGFEATKSIRSFNQTIPIIAMTANALASDKERVMSEGMTDFISKPIDVSAMFKVISQHIVPSHPHFADVSGEDAPENHNSHDPMQHFLVIEKHSGLATCNDNEVLYLKILKKFFNAEQTFEQRFKPPWQAQDWTEATRIAHSLKGSAGNIGAKNLYQVAADLEQACKSQLDKEQVSHKLKLTLSKLSEVLTELDIMQQIINSEPAQAPEPVGKIALSEDELNDKLNHLQSLVDEFDTDAQEIAFELEQMFAEQSIKQQFNTFITQLENFDFDSANQTLASVKKLILK
ncbi:response regulator [Catenovulum sp. SM1970]|uniref:response regulator n=1 Tax=Marinifaba aquimaris TaxID=2741323 RepID=UPI001571F61A|nr:response regulator [Marinifaba aquimaris]NTS75519.1 response regulator [Marinifaba aquimaris]